MAKLTTKFEDKSIKQKLNYGYMVVIIFMVISGLVSIFGLYTLDRTLNDFVNGANKADTAVKVCRINTNVAARNIREMALNDDTSTYPEYRQTVETELQEVDTQLKNLKETGIIENDLYEEYKEAITDWANIGYEIIEEIEGGNRQHATERILSECAPALNNLVATSDKLDKMTDEKMTESINKSKIIFFVALAVIIVFIMIAVFAAVRISKRIITAIMDPLHEVEAVAIELSKGNLHSNLEYHATDEIGKLAHSLRKSIRILSSYVDDIARSMGEFSKGNFDVQPEVEWKGDFVDILDAFMVFEKNMADTVKGIQSVAGQVESGAGQVSDSSMDLAQGATEQATVTEELANTIQNISQQVASNVESAKEISKKVEKSGVDIVQGNEKMQEMVESMGEINSASQEISKIIDSINEIASQTNLLALNASIEAARAGEAGKGFAVVADQVSLLASQSAEAVKESTVLIETSINAVEKGIVIADETAKQLERVAKDSKSVTKSVTEIADALEAQTESFTKVNEDVDNINDVVQTNSATSQECAAASEEMSSQATMLTNLISKFKVGTFED